jgi:glycosyltransferase involved in cell wall biosynthesis
MLMASLVHANRSDMQDASGLHVTVAICTWNRCALLQQTLEQMTRLIVPAELRWEVLVVNNRSTDATADTVRAFAGRLPIRMVDEPQAGLSHARNRALEASDADLLLFTDDDVMVEPSWLTAFVEAAARHPDAAGFGGPIAPWFRDPIDPIIVEAFPIVASGFCGLDHGEPERALAPTDEIYGACMGFRRARLGGLAFDPTLGPVESTGRVGDETDFLTRLRARGEQVIWVPTMRLQHYVDPKRATMGYLRRYHDQKGQLWVRNLGVPEGTRFLGAPRWLWRKAGEAWVKSCVRAASRQRVQALVERRRYWWLKGMIKACRRSAVASWNR